VLISGSVPVIGRAYRDRTERTARDKARELRAAASALANVSFGSNSEVGGCLVDGLLCHCERTSPDPRFRSAKGHLRTHAVQQPYD